MAQPSNRVLYSRQELKPPETANFSGGNLEGLPMLNREKSAQSFCKQLMNGKTCFWS
jgi:hypothetical protein